MNFPVTYEDYIFLDHSYILHLIYQTYIAKILQYLLLQICKFFHLVVRSRITIKREKKVLEKLRKENLKEISMQ